MPKYSPKRITMLARGRFLYAATSGEDVYVGSVSDEATAAEVAHRFTEFHRLFHAVEKLIHADDAARGGAMIALDAVYQRAAKEVGS